MSEKIYPKGLRTFKPHENAPEFVKGTLIITPSELIKFCEENPNLMKDYKGALQLRCQMLDGENGIYITVDTYNPTETSEAKAEPIQGPESDLPF